MTIRIAGTVNDSIVDGPGLRFTVFVQGCASACEGCQNPQTWDRLGGKEVEIDEIVGKIRKNPLLSGVTLSGGEPFLQAEECAEIARAAHGMRLNVWVYTGYWFEDIYEANLPEWDSLLEWTDVLVDGPFIESMKSYEAKFRGSWNQRLIWVPASFENFPEVRLWREPEYMMRDFEVPES